MAKITPIRSTPAVPPQRTGLRDWLGHLRDIVDRLVYQLIRMPSKRAGKAKEAGRKKARH